MNGMCNEQLIDTLTEAAVKQLAEKQHDCRHDLQVSKLGVILGIMLLIAHCH